MSDISSLSAVVSRWHFVFHTQMVCVSAWGLPTNPWTIRKRNYYATTEFETLLYTTAGPVAIITLNRPERLNTIVSPIDTYR
jgi:hypothetical protein